MALEDPDDFSTFFDQLSRMTPDETPPTNFGAPSDPVVAAADPVVEPAAAVEPVVVEPVTAAVDPAVVEPVVAEPAAAEPVVEPVVEPVAVAPTAPVQGDNTELLTRLADMLAQRQPAPVAQPVQQQPAQRIYTDDETTKLTQFQKDWPDIAEAFALMARGSAAQNNAYVFNELAKVLGPQLQSMQTVQSAHQYDSLRTAIPDYDTVRDPVIEWVKTDKRIPGYLRTAYDGVIQNGDVGEITDLVNRWRDATGKSPRTIPAARANELSPAAKQAAAALAPVAAKRATVVQSEPSGFDDAFEAFAKA